MKLRKMGCERSDLRFGLATSDGNYSDTLQRGMDVFDVLHRQ